MTAEMRISKNYSKYYRDVLVKHNLTKDKFDTIISWYTAHPKLYLEVYDDVISMLSEKEAEESNLIEKKDTRITSYNVCYTKLLRYNINFRIALVNDVT